MCVCVTVLVSMCECVSLYGLSFGKSDYTLAFSDKLFHHCCSDRKVTANVVPGIFFFIFSNVLVEYILFRD